MNIVFITKRPKHLPTIRMVWFAVNVSHKVVKVMKLKKKQNEFGIGELKMTDNVNCCSAPRNYEAEINQLQKENKCIREEITRLADKNELLEKCIVEMSVTRYVFNER
jgi:cell division protein FtsB